MSGRSNEPAAAGRIAWLDGLKGLACLGVFTHHFFLAFFRSSYFGKEAASLLPGGFDTLLSYKPYGVFVNGNFYVCLFLLIASFLPALRIMRSPDPALRDTAGTMILRRYPRLMLPAFCVCVLNYILLCILNATGMNYMGAGPGYSPAGLLMHALVLMWVKADSLLIGPFWTLHYLLFVPLLAMLLAIPARAKAKWPPFVYGGLMIAFLEYDILFDYYLAAVLGVLLAWFVCRFDEACLFKRRTVPLTGSILLLLAGLWFGGYPSYAEPEGAYRIFSFLTERNNGASVVLHIIGAFLLVAGLYFWQRAELPDLLRTKPVLWLGKHGYAIFMLHMLWVDLLGYYLMDRMKEWLGSAAAAAIPLYLILLLATLLSSWLFTSTVEKWCEKLCRRIRCSEK